MFLKLTSFPSGDAIGIRAGQVHQVSAVTSTKGPALPGGTRIAFAAPAAGFSAHVPQIIEVSEDIDTVLGMLKAAEQ